MANYSYWWRASGEWSYWWRVVPTGGELLILVSSQWRVVLLVASGRTGGEWSYWWRATRTGIEPVASDPTGGEW